MAANVTNNVALLDTPGVQVVTGAIRSTDGSPRAVPPAVQPARFNDEMTELVVPAVEPN